MKLAYLLEEKSLWVFVEIRAVMKQGVIPSVSILDYALEKKLPSEFFTYKYSRVSALLTFINSILFSTKKCKLFYWLKSKIGFQLSFRTFYLAKIYKINQIDHIHTHFAETATYAAQAIWKITGIPFSFTAHAYDIFTDRINLNNLRSKMEDAVFIRTISNYNKQYLTSLFPKAEPKIHIIHCGINLENFKYNENFFNSNLLQVRSASNLVEKKGYIQFLNTFEDIDYSQINFEWEIAGNGPLKNKISFFIKAEKLSKYIKLTDSIRHDKLNDYFTQCDIFFLPCTIAKSGDRDGIPVILMEAMAAGCIVVSTSISGIPELINNEINGFLLKNNSVTELIKLIEHIKRLNSVQLKEIKRNAYDTVNKYFNVKSIVKTHLSYINS